ncbi:long-chain fatty acid transport protein 4-like [Tropilaelaps mercedesae]|uniref:Very long-chain fatty acid transport protein n=1 Tax=Tropilaelaps mercedesae TaxID=418985 RepID=A0A1V9XJQ0_9ACAR|nr:long-chain fatty acid transport protein 4-like [Tropilaelaps mercedesae]
MAVLVLVLGVVGALIVGYVLMWWHGMLVCVLLFLVLRARHIWLTIRTLRRDLSAAVRYWRSGIILSWICWRNKTVPLLFQERVAAHPGRVMFIEADRQWTFQDVDEYTNKLANYFARSGFRPGDDVALVMENRVDIVLFWLAMSKLGVVTALINFNLRRSPLLHCLRAIDSKAVVFSPKMAPFVLEVGSELCEKLHPKFYSYGASDVMTKLPVENLLPALETSSRSFVVHRGSLEDKLLYMYTSGTTGVPKAAVIKHLRYIYLAYHIHHMMPLRDSDVLYISLPLYHLAGGILGTSQSVVFGNSGVVVPKFSSSNFWTDCIKHKCTVAQYIGEICRYLYIQPERQTDKQHRIRLMFGNGLRPQIWADFKARFGIEHIREMYGSTEGNTNLINTDDTVGSIGFLPTFCRHYPLLAPLIFNLEIIKVDPQTGVPVRAKNGRCIRVGPNDPGEVIARIKRKALIRFDGYTDDAATSNKIYKDVFWKGDQFFSSGDVLLYDDLGYVYFKDRTGDTFRWRGENVSTTEVEGIISKNTGAQDCVVYGVEVPGAEGKAGMATLLDAEQKTNLADLLSKMRAELPPYAVPLFLRLAKEIELTSTFKLKKVELARDGYDITKTSDPIFCFDKSVDAYVRMDDEIYMKILNRLIHF